VAEVSAGLHDAREGRDVRIVKCVRAGRWFLLALIAPMLAAAAWDAAAAAGAVVLLAAFLLTRPAIRDLEHQNRIGRLEHQNRPPLDCLHGGAVPVDTVKGERVAWLCPDCDAQLPALYGQDVTRRTEEL
jgi:hypothetical protein